MLPLDWIGRIIPRPGTLLVRRDEAPETYGTFIIIPPSAAGKTRSSMATVEAVGWGVTGFAPGDRILVAVGVSRKAVFGERDEQTLYSVALPEVIMRLSEGAEAEVLGQAAVGRQRLSQAEEMALERKADEGRPAGPAR